MLPLLLQIVELKHFLLHNIEVEIDYASVVVDFIHMWLFLSSDCNLKSTFVISLLR